MIDKYEMELQELEKNNQIEDKLMLMSIYNEMFNHLKYSMSSYYRDYYEKLMRITFKETVGNVHNSKEFLVEFLTKLKNDRVTSLVNGTIDIINYFLEMADSYFEEMNYVAVIDEFNLPFDIKTRVLVTFRNQVNNIFGRIGTTFGDSEEVKNLVNAVMDYLIDTIYIYLLCCTEQGVKIEDMCNYLEEVLTRESQSALVCQFRNGKFSFDLITNDELRAYFKSFKKCEQDVLLMGMTYGLSGCSGNDSDEERAKEICDVLGISRVKYRLITMSLARKKAMLERHDEKAERKK